MSYSFDNAYNQSIVYWSYTGLDKYGKPTYASPTTIKAFTYSDKSYPVNGNVQISREAFWIQTATRIVNHSWVYLGATTDFTAGTEPAKVAGARLVTSVTDEYDFFGDRIYSTAGTT